VLEFIQDMVNLVEFRPDFVAAILGLPEQSLEPRTLEFKNVWNVFDNEDRTERNYHSEAIVARFISVEKKLSPRVQGGCFAAKNKTAARNDAENGFKKP